MPITSLIPWRRGERRLPIRREEEHPLRVLQRDMNRLFDEFFGGFGLAPFGMFREPWDVFSPRVDVVENDKEVRVSAELPGMDENEIEVSLANDVLTISGEKKEEAEHRGRDYYHMERSYGAFRRSIPLPSEVEADKAEATFKRGVLTVVLPKTEQARARKRIPIRTG